MRFLVDESCDYRLVNRLRNNDIDVLSILEEHQGVDDERIIELASTEDRILLTEDRDRWIYPVSNILFLYSISLADGPYPDLFMPVAPRRLLKTLVSSAVQLPSGSRNKKETMPNVHRRRQVMPICAAKLGRSKRSNIPVTIRL